MSQPDPPELYLISVKATLPKGVMETDYVTNVILFSFEIWSTNAVLACSTGEALRIFLMDLRDGKYIDCIKALRRKGHVNIDAFKNYLTSELGLIELGENIGMTVYIDTFKGYRTKKEFNARKALGTIEEITVGIHASRVADPNPCF